MLDFTTPKRFVHTHYYSHYPGRWRLKKIRKLSNQCLGISFEMGSIFSLFSLLFLQATVTTADNEHYIVSNMLMLTIWQGSKIECKPTYANLQYLPFFVHPVGKVDPSQNAFLP